MNQRIVREDPAIAQQMAQAQQQEQAKRMAHMAKIKLIEDTSSRIFGHLVCIEIKQLEDAAQEKVYESLHRDEVPPSTIPKACPGYERLAHLADIARLCSPFLAQSWGIGVRVPPEEFEAEKKRLGL